jgi:hypothetical protein
MYEKIVLMLILLADLAILFIEYGVYKLYSEYFNGRKKEQEARRENARKAGIASGVARKEKKDEKIQPS